MLTLVRKLIMHSLQKNTPKILVEQLINIVFEPTTTALGEDMVSIVPHVVMKRIVSSDIILLEILSIASQISKLVRSPAVSLDPRNALM